MPQSRDLEDNQAQYRVLQEYELGLSEVSVHETLTYAQPLRQEDLHSSSIRHAVCEELATHLIILLFVGKRKHEVTEDLCFKLSRKDQRKKAWAIRTNTKDPLIIRWWLNRASHG